MSDVTFVIQGMLHPNCIPALPLYLMHGDVIISCWDTSYGLLKDGAVNSKSRMIPLYLQNFKNFYVAKTKHTVKTIMRKSKSLKQLSEEKVYNYNNAYYQFDSTLAGLSQVTTKYAVKLRCDEFYTFIDPILDKMREASSESKLTTSNTWFRKSAEFPWHPSDHIVAGRTDNMINAFKKAKTFCERGGYFEPQDGKRIVGQEENFTQYKFNKSPTGKKRFDMIEVAFPTPVPEQIIGLSHILSVSNNTVDYAKRKEDMKKYFNVVPTNELGFFSVSRKMRVDYRKQYTFDTSMSSPLEMEWSVLKSLEEIQ